MIVFKNYFNIVKRHLGIIIMFSAISIGASVINTSYTSTKDYVSVEPKIAVINYDESSLSNNFVDYITERAEIVEVEDNEKAIEDLSLEELKCFSEVFDEDIYDFIDYENILNKGIKKNLK